MAVIKDLGAVTAYASAVEGGYTGTKEEFATLMASYASVAEEAAESAESASQSATQASASAQTATTKASEASASATQAGASATSASQSATTASTKASEASASASTAGTKASEASASATTASSKASEASASATSAQTAQGLAESARDDAIDAKTDAETARDLAQQYAESIDPDNIYSAYPTDTASGAVATFTDGADDIPMKSVKVAIEPVQDLHGYDHPWPAGGGKNLFGLKQWLDSLNITYAQQGEKFTITSNGSLYTNPWVFSDTDVEVKFSCKSFTNGTATQARITFLDTGGNIVSSRYTDDILSLTTTASKCRFDWSSGGTFSIEEAQIELGSTATSFVPYSNICPISGWTGAQVVRTGVNVCDEEWESGNLTSNTGENVDDASRIRSKNYIPIFPNTTYYAATNGKAIGIRYYDASKTFLGQLTNSIKTNAIFTTPSNAYFIRFSVVDTTTYYHDISINYPSTDHDYHPFTGSDTYSITFPSEVGTVYGGELDVTNGVLTVDRAMVDLGTLSWNKKVSGVFYTWDLRDVLKAVSSASQTANAKCSSLKLGSYINVYDNSTLDYAISIGTNSQVGAQCSAYAEAADFKSAMNGVQFCYELAEPITYTLTPTEIKSLLGDNNIWADAGDTAVTYRADTKLYIDKRIGTEAPMIATDNIVSGSYFMVGDNLYKATANIASGATVIVGTNAVAKTMAEALNEINA